MLRRFLIRAVVFYQEHLSGLKSGASCRFEPSCSAYSLRALEEYGALRGTIMTLVRLAKCGPWHPGGYDPVVNRPNSVPPIKDVP